MIPDEVREFLNEWLEGEEARDAGSTIEWLVDQGMTDPRSLKKFLVDVYRNHIDDPDMREYALKAKRAADLL